MKGILGFRVIQSAATPGPEARIEKLDRRLAEWSRAQESHHKIFAIQAHASIMKTICDDLRRSRTGANQQASASHMLIELDVVFPGPSAKLIAILKEAGIRANVFTTEVPPAYEGSPALELSPADQPPAYNAQPFPLSESAAAPLVGFRSGFVGLPAPLGEADIDDDFPPPPPPDATELIRESLRRAAMPDAAAPANALKATLIETIEQICSEGSLPEKLRNLENLATSLERSLPSEYADVESVQLVAKVFSDVLVPAVHRLSPGEAPGKFELLRLVQLYCEGHQGNRAHPLADADHELEGVLPLALQLEIEFCLVEFASGKASAANKSLTARFDALIKKISNLREPRVQLDALGRIYYGVFEPARKNKSASKAFAASLFKEHLLPAIERVNADTRELQKMKLPLLVNGWK